MMSLQDLINEAKAKLPTDVYSRVMSLRRPEDLLEKRLAKILFNGYLSSFGVQDALHIISIFANNPPEETGISKLDAIDRRALDALKSRKHSVFLGTPNYGERDLSVKAGK